MGEGKADAKEGKGRCFLVTYLSLLARTRDTEREREREREREERHAKMAAAVAAAEAAEAAAAAAHRQHAHDAINEGKTKHRKRVSCQPQQPRSTVDRTGFGASVV